MSTDPAHTGGPSPGASTEAEPPFPGARTEAEGPGRPSSQAHAEPLALADYIRALVGLLDAEEPASAERLRRAVGRRVARIRFDQQAVLVSFTGTALTVRECAAREPARNELPRNEPPPSEPAPDKTAPDKTADGSGGTDSATVRELLAGRLEITDAILSGRIEVSGNSAGLTAILFAIEILLDAAARIPGLRALSASFSEPPAELRARSAPARRTPDPELRLLARLDLLP